MKLSEAYAVAIGHFNAGQLAWAVDICRRIIAIEPDHEARRLLVESLNSQAVALKRQWKLGEAIRTYDEALSLSETATIHYNRAVALIAQGRVEEAIAGYERAYQLEPSQSILSNLLLARQYREVSLERPARPLRRLGFVSPDFCRSPVAFFLLPFLENVGAEVYCYWQRTTEDEFTERFRQLSTFREIQTFSDEEVAAQIRADEVEVLFDLAGHTGGNRLGVFALRPALRVAWIGYPGSTGAADYLIADPQEVPEELVSYYPEKIIRLASYVSYLPPQAPPVAPLPAFSGRVTFGSFNNPAKISGEVVEVWNTILARVPGSRLVLKYFGLEDRETAAQLKRRFQGQVEVHGGTAHDKLLAAYNEVDIALDTYPYNGGLTTCEALWMGVPVVTLPGETFASRPRPQPSHGCRLHRDHCPRSRSLRRLGRRPRSGSATIGSHPSWTPRPGLSFAAV